MALHDGGIFHNLKERIRLKNSAFQYINFSFDLFSIFDIKKAKRTSKLDCVFFNPDMVSRFYVLSRELIEG